MKIEISFESIKKFFLYCYSFLDVTVSVRVSRSMMCNILHPLYCACMHKGNRPDIELSKMSKLYQQAAETLVASGRYDRSLCRLLIQGYMCIIIRHFVGLIFSSSKTVYLIPVHFLNLMVSF